MPVTNDRVLGSDPKYNAVFTDKKDNTAMEPMDFMKLMVAQMQNQDFTNPMDNSQMVTQMAQFSNMQQMQQMAAYSKTSYAMSLIGKTVTASRFTVSGDLDTVTAPVSKVSLVDNGYVLYVGGKKYSLEQIMAIQAGGGSSGVSMVDPTSYPLVTKTIAPDSATLEWKVPTEDAQTAAGLKYTVYYSTEKDFNTVEQVEAGTLSGAAAQKGVTTTELNGLKPDTQYYANVVVTDENGVKTVYRPASFKTTIA